MKDPNAVAKTRLAKQAESMREFLEELDRIESVAPDRAGDENFKMPYTSPPEFSSPAWKLTLDA